MLLTLPGLPLIYTGQEVGAAFEPYSEGPPIAWTDRYDLRGHYARLVALRHALPALRSREMRRVETSRGDTVLADLRPAAVPQENLLVLLNFGATPETVSLSRENGVAAVTGGGRIVDLLSGETLALRPEAPAVALPAFGARLLRRAEHALVAPTARYSD